MTHPTDSLSAELRSRTREEHRATEQTPIARSLVDGTVTPSNVASYLEVFARCLAALDVAVSTSDDVWVRRYRELHHSRAAALAHDAQLLPRPALPSSAVWSLERVGRLMQRGGMELVGAAYVLEGSTLGGLVLGPRVERALALPPRSLSYFWGWGEETMPRWSRWKRAVDAWELSGPQVDSAVEAARNTFIGIREAMAEIPSGERAMSVEPGALAGL